VKDRERKVDPDSLREASREFPSTFFNVDEKGDPVCIPHSPCPVILGIRGIDPSDTLEALKMVRAKGYERWVLWKTNQHTDAHIESIEDLSALLPFSSISADVIVTSPPEYRERGHLFFRVKDGKKGSAVCAAYEPTKNFRKRLSGLVPGDRIRVWGSVRSEDVPSPTINLEKIKVMELAALSEMSNPRCPECSGPTESMGKGQGLRCKKCGYRGLDLKPIQREIKRDIEIGMVQPPPDAWRHLFKPLKLPPKEEKSHSGPWWGIGIP
jgi:tRNA(Ile2)-agmatinylcytidine synthase